MECGFSKVVLVVINVIFLIFGFAILIAGIVFKVGFDVFKDALVEKTGSLDFNLKYAGETLGVIVIVFGCAIILIAGIGCLGACCHSRLLLAFYGVIVAVLLLAEIIAVAVALVKGKEATDILDTGLVEALHDYHDKVTAKTSKDKAFDAIFSTFQCCGVNNYTDFYSASTDWDPRNTNKKIPVACCTTVNYEDIEDTTFSDSNIQKCLALSSIPSSYAYTNGCFQSLLDYVSHYKYVVIGVAVAIFLIELLVCILAFCMCCNHKNND